MSLSTPLDELIPPPDEINNTHKQYSIAITCVVLGVFASLFVIARLASRWHSRTLGLDDYAAIPALILYLGWTALAGYINLHAGVGKPLWEITVGEFSLWYHGIVITAFLYPIMSAAIRISIIFFYRRIFGDGHDTIVKHTLWLLLGLHGAYIITFVVLPGFFCDSLPEFWDVFNHRLHCHDWYYFYSQVGLYSASLAFDIILLLLPVVPVFRLRLPLRKRLWVLLIFALGTSASVVASYKLAIFDTEMRHYVPTNLKWLEYQLSRFVPGQFDKYGYTFWIPSQLEPPVALIGTSLPAIQPLFQTSSGSFVDMLVSRLKLRSLVESFTSGGKSSITKSRPLPSGDFMVMDENNSNIELNPRNEQGR
ncbi:hypothetical protein GGR55DRAFT_701198 [Xylaria sp. FL0064]|nr:hypothetical protein GGR55DRAFT_701198 [Xylaria sp. FL0064]